MTKHEQIPMPSDAERKQSISAILDARVIPEKSLWKNLASVRSLPLSMLFLGVGDCLFLALLFALLCIIPASAAASEQHVILPLLFLLSPALYASLHLLTRWKESMSGTLEWKQTCKLSFGSLTAVRMLLFGGAATLLCVPQSALLWYIGGMEIPLLWMLSVSFASLFLYAALSLALARRRSWMLMAAAPGGWLCIGASLLYWDKAALFLLKVPAAVFIILSAAALAAVYVQIKSMILRPIERGTSYVIG